MKFIYHAHICKVLLKTLECTSLYSNKKLTPEWALITVNFGTTQKIGSKVGWRVALFHGWAHFIETTIHIHKEYVPIVVCV